MQAIRRVGPSARPLSLRPLSLRPLSFSSHRSVSHASEKGKGSASLGESIIPISNIEAQWNTMTEDEQALVHRQLEELQKKDWKSLSLDEKRAGKYPSRVKRRQIPSRLFFTIFFPACRFTAPFSRVFSSLRLYSLTLIEFNDPFQFLSDSWFAV